MQKVTRVFILRQVEIDFRKVKKGDLFCLEVSDGEKTETSDWSMALEDATADGHIPNEFYVPSDKVYLVVGKPEISKIIINQKHIVNDNEIPEKRVLQ
jgi:hypothetical protein